jgi:hypothetical protein
MTLTTIGLTTRRVNASPPDHLVAGLDANSPINSPATHEGQAETEANGETDMAAAPQWKIYRDGEYVAACKHPEDAAALVAMSGGVVKLGHSVIVWCEGSEEFEAGDSYDRAASIMQQRAHDHNVSQYERVYGKGAA